MGSQGVGSILTQGYGFTLGWVYFNSGLWAHIRVGPFYLRPMGSQGVGSILTQGYGLTLGWGHFNSGLWVYTGLGPF